MIRRERFRPANGRLNPDLTNRGNSSHVCIKVAAEDIVVEVVQTEGEIVLHVPAGISLQSDRVDLVAADVQGIAGGLHVPAPENGDTIECGFW